MITWLPIIFLACGVVTFLFCGLAKNLFPTFRSGEHKPGTHRQDQPAGGREIRTYELPLVGGPTFTLVICGIGVGAGYFLHFTQDQWILLLIALGATVGYAFVGFLDDWRKVYRKQGLSEIAKFGGVFLVSITAAILYFFLLPDSGQISYTFWKDVPILNHLLCPSPSTDPTCRVSLDSPVSYFGWLIFLVLMTGVVGTLTSLSVDFSDGLDGLAGGLVFSSSLAVGIVVAGLIDSSTSTGLVLEVLALLIAGATLGFLPWNWPSAWAARRGSATRRAKLYMGDSGALALGGLLAIVAIFARNETLLLMIGGAFVLEGLSVVISARVMTKIFRRSLKMLRFENQKEFVPHTEFPLPFLATPLHQHFDLLGWDRRRLVYGAWALGACFAALGVMISLNTLTWQRWVGRILILILALLIWSSGSWSKNYFVGKHRAENSRRRRLALYYGYPYRLMGIRLYHMVEVIEASEDVIETPAEELALWQRMNIFDARAMLGLYCYRAGYYPAALAQWSRITDKNRLLRPEIKRLMNEVDERLNLEKQETQPLRKEDILKQQEPIIIGNLPLADLPNPHEPISNEEIQTHAPSNWNPTSPPPSDPDNGEPTQTEADEERIVTLPLSNSMPLLDTTEEQDTSPEKPIITLTALPESNTNRPSWFARFFRSPSEK